MPIDSMLNTIAEGLEEFVGPVTRRTEFSVKGEIMLVWNTIRVRLALRMIGDHKLAVATVDGGGRKISFESSASREAVRSAGTSVKRRLVRAQGTGNADEAATAARVRALATMVRAWPKLASFTTETAPKTIEIGRLTLVVHDSGFVSIRMAEIDEIEADDAVAIAIGLVEALGGKSEVHDPSLDEEWAQVQA